MSFGTSIPTTVASSILEALKGSLVYGKLFNQDYQGLVAPGNTVKVISIGDVSTDAYIVGTPIESADAADSAATLTINKQRYFSIVLDDVYAALAKPDILGAYLKQGVHALQADVDKDLAAELVATATLTTGFGTASVPLEINSVNICAQLYAMARALDDANVPRSERYIVLPPAFIEKLNMASIAIATNNADVLRDGIVAKFAGFNVLMSPNVPNTSGAVYRIFAGSPISSTYAIAVDKIEVVRSQTAFADNLRGLAVYGAKCVRPATVVSAVWNIAEEPADEEPVG